MLDTQMMTGMAPSTKDLYSHSSRRPHLLLDHRRMDVRLYSEHIQYSQLSSRCFHVVWMV